MFECSFRLYFKRKVVIVAFCLFLDLAGSYNTIYSSVSLTYKCTLLGIGVRFSEEFLYIIVHYDNFENSIYMHALVSQINGSRGLVRNFAMAKLYISI